jgi:phage major head subunit gpT-like protein
MSLQALDSRAIIGEFFLRLSQNPGSAWINQIGMTFNTNQEIETYKWLGQVPTMREWVGGRNAKGLTDNGLSITSKTYESTLEMNVDELRRDKTGQALIRIRELADRVNAHWASLLSTQIMNGTSSSCYDGQNFFDTDHTEGNNSSNQSNDLTNDISAAPVTNHGIVTAPSVGEMNHTILTAIQSILGFKDNENEPMNEGATSFLVMVPTALWHVAQAAVSMPTIDSQASNVMGSLGMNISVVANPRLTWTDSIAVFRRDGNAKPFILQSEMNPKVTAIAEGSELEFKENKHQYGVKAIRNVGYGFWQHAAFIQMT